MAHEPAGGAVAPSIVDALRRRRQAQLEERLKAGGEWADWEGAGLVFTAAKGRPWHPRNVLRDFQRGLMRAGLHDLRHGCATLLLVEGERPRVVADLLAHNDVRLTLGTYQGRVERAVRLATDRIDAALSRG